MQLVSDLQQRPNKGRLKMEKKIVSFYDLCSLVQIVTLIIHTVTVTISAKRTFVNNFYVNNNFELSPTLQYKTRTCVYNTTRNIYAFQGVTMSFSAATVNDVFVDNAIQMRLAIFVMVATLAVAVVNRGCVESNVFSIKFRSFYLYKDVLSAVELLLLGYVIQIGVAATPPASLLSDYLTSCGVRTDAYLPYMNRNSIYVFAGVGYFSWVVGTCLYLWNTLPKYGVMNANEIEEYKVWLRQRNMEIAQSRALIEEAKRAHARLQIMQSTEYLGGPHGAAGSVPLSMMPGAPMGPYGYGPGVAGPSAYPPNAYMGEMMRRGLSPAGYASAATMPPAQLYGAGMMPVPSAGAYTPGTQPPMQAGMYPALAAQQQQQLQQQQMMMMMMQQQQQQQPGMYASAQQPLMSPPLQGMPSMGGMYPAGAGEVPNMPRRRVVNQAGADVNGAPSMYPNTF